MYKLKLLEEVEAAYLLRRDKYSALDNKLLQILENPHGQKSLGQANYYYINAGSRYAFTYKVSGKTVIVAKLVLRAYLYRLLKLEDN
jgi:hypothetical protein